MQPLLDLLGDAPEFFVARQNTTGDILVLTFALTLVPPAVATALEAAARRFSPPLQRGLHLALVGVLLAALALQAIRSIGGAVVPVALAVLIGAAGAAAYARTRLVPTVLTVLAPAPLVFVVAFLVLSPVSGLVFEGDEAVAADVRIPDQTPVVMIVFDELSGLALMGPDRRIDAARLPSFGRLARDATWYRNATSVSDFTDRAVPAMLTGERPERNSLPTSSDNPESLFTLLGRSHDFHVSEPVTDICPQRLCPAETADRVPAGERLGELASDLSVVSLHLLLPDDLRRDLPPIDRSFGGFGDDAAGISDAKRLPGAQVHADAAFSALRGRDEQFEAFMSGLGRRSRKPALSFLHVAFPHNPYDHFPDGRRYVGAVAGLDGEGNKPGGTWRKDRAVVSQGLERYLLQVGYTDRLLGRVLARLRESGLYDRSLIVVAADHGVSFVPGLPSRAVEAGNFEGIASVPLLVKAPGQGRGRIDDANVTAIDILPTIASELDVRLPWPVDGVLPGRRGPGVPVEMQPRVDEGSRSLPFAEFVRRRDAALRRMSAEFRLGRPVPERRSVPDSDLVGRRVASLRLAATGQGQVELDHADALRSVDLDGDTVPFVVSGRLADAEPGERLAVALNGRVATVVLPYGTDGEWRFTALVPTERFSPGVNRVQLVRVAGAGAGRRMSLMDSGDVDARLVRDGEGEAIVEPGGRRIPIASGVEGHVDRTSGGEGLVLLDGWAADTQTSRPAERVIAFSGSRFVGSARLVVARPDLVKAYGRRLAKAGFKVAGPTARAPAGSPAPELRVFAVLDGKASPIEGVKPPTGG